MESSISSAEITKLIYTEITYVLDYLSELDFYGILHIYVGNFAIPTESYLK